MSEPAITSPADAGDDEPVPHLAFFLPSLRGGGAERSVLNLAAAFARDGAKVDLVLAQAAGPYLPDVPPNVRLVDLKAGRVLASLPPLVRYLRQERPQSLFAALDHANIIAIWARALARVGTRTVVSVRTTRGGTNYTRSSRRARLIPFLMRRLYPKADAVVAVSHGVADDVARICRLSSQVIATIYNPIISDELFEQAVQPLDHPWFCQGEPPVILSAGRLIEDKDFSSLIRAFAILRQRGVRARLVILGEGEDRGRLEDLVRHLGLDHDVSLPGFQRNPYQFMQRSAVFALSSRREGLPGALIQALACGCSIVSTDCPSGPSEVLEGGRWGRLVPVGDIEALAAALEAALAEGGRSVDPAAIQPFRADVVLAQYRKILLGAS